ncbi:MAG: hypothetical protein J2P24_16810 [Streptosporangiales bacterium]|nr:hypothetical protein [Streptosporangiales bacterium]MBO0890593.1 hypothetical protein [Acidothermales bacterium]
MDMQELGRHSEALGFVPQESVRWLEPGQLLQTAVKVVLSQVFADYDDKREIQAALPMDEMRAPSRDPDADEMWLDFVADLGDGFDPTYTIAWLLGRPRLDVDGAPGLPRGSLLVMGGDEVYPTPSARAYEDRLKGPYAAALRTADDDPLLVALPGNHDWYDGLTSFLRVFAQGRKVGGWRTAQSRSYFAVALPNRWWLLGVDTQLGTYIDGPQLDYFEQRVTRNLRPGDGVIICAATPTWVHSALDDVHAFDALHWFERTYIRTRCKPDSDERESTGASVRLWITGDAHHYVRYTERLPDEDDRTAASRPDPRRRQLVTCGMGGAYMRTTHWLPKRLVLPPPGSRAHRKDHPVTYVRGPVTWPDLNTSRLWTTRLAQPWSKYWVLRRNPGFGQLCGGVQAALFLVAAFVFGLTQARPPVNAVRAASVGSVLWFDVEALIALVIVGVLPSLVQLVFWHRWARPPSALLAVYLQVLVTLLTLTTLAVVPWPASWPDWLLLAVFLAFAAAVGAGLGAEAFVGYALTARRGAIEDLQIAAQAVEDVKGFVRMHVGADGDLTLYPVLVPKVCHDWALDEDDATGRARPRPTREPEVRLAEPPIVIAREPAGAAVETASHDEPGLSTPGTSGEASVDHENMINPGAAGTM